jgi:glucose 1-dehydrogenase
MDAQRFRGKVALVSGGASGIGRTTCTRLAEEGCRVFIADVDAQGALKTLDLIHSRGGAGQFFQTDIADPAQIEALVASVARESDEIHYLVNDAAMMVFKSACDLSVKEWDQVLNVNLRSVFLFCKFAIPHIRRGAIVNISSVHAHETTRNVSAYAASKGAIEAFTRALSIECDPSQIRVNSLAPGAVNTPMLWANPNVKSGAEKIEGAIGTPVNIADCVLFLLSDQAAFIHGTTLVVDGGRLDIL